jgi:hypothetical protein
MKALMETRWLGMIAAFVVAVLMLLPAVAHAHTHGHSHSGHQHTQPQAPGAQPAKQGVTHTKATSQPPATRAVANDPGGGLRERGSLSSVSSSDAGASLPVCLRGCCPSAGHGCCVMALPWSFLVAPPPMVRERLAVDAIRRSGVTPGVLPEPPRSLA